MAKTPYKMTLSISVLEDLGINLYSNIAAVLSEVVANAWDADADNVWIDTKPSSNQIVIEDDGHGMSRQEINRKYLLVGYKRRSDKHGRVTRKHKRRVMGRKGIGKLSLFSIAEKIEVFTHDGIKGSGFRMELAKIRESLKKHRKDYRPQPIDELPRDLTKGTRIVLTGIKEGSWESIGQLRTKLARRFSVLGDLHKFNIHLNDQTITLDDRDYFPRIQFVWTYGDLGALVADKCANRQHLESRANVVDGGGTVEGWIGTVEKSTQLKEGKDNLNKVLLVVRGKVAKEDLLDKLNEGGIYTKYLIGELRADFLDVDEKPDIATSSRQDIKEDDPRFQALLIFLRSELKRIENTWSDLRPEVGFKKAMKVAALKKWFDALRPDNQKAARKMIGLIHMVELEKEADRKDLLVYGILAFERLQHRTQLEELRGLDQASLPAFVAAFRNLDDLEATLYHGIVRTRVEVIRTLEEHVKKNSLEKVVQELLWDHLWLLDTSWERATDTGYLERTVGAEFEKLGKKVGEKEAMGRLDIKYKTVTGKHVIVELKRPDRNVTTPEILAQMEKYHAQLRRILEENDRASEPIECVVLLGHKPQDWKDTSSEERMRGVLEKADIRVVFYGTMLETANRQYGEFLERKKQSGRIEDLVRSIQDAGAEPSGPAVLVATASKATKAAPGRGKVKQQRFRL